MSDREQETGSVLSVERLAVSFGARPGLAGVTLTVEAGERLVIIGPSGVGKTSLLRSIAGLEPVTAGTVRVRGADVTARDPDRRNIVYLHQTPVLFDHLTVGENIAFPLRVRGGRGTDVDARVRSVQSWMRLDGFEHRMPRTLSGGQRHRVALGRAIAATPAALLLDEPLSALDPALREEVSSAIVAAQAEYGPPMVMVTHDLDDAALLADRIAVLLDGGVAQIATPEKLFHRPATLGVARFLGLHVEVPGRVDATGSIITPLGRLPTGRSTAADLKRQATVVVAIRGESVQLGPPGDAVPGRVIAVRPRPRGASVIVRVGDDPGIDVEAVRRPGDPATNVGDAVSVRLDPDQVCIFPT